MTASEWSRLCGLVAALWVTTPWEEPTRAAGWLVCCDLSYDQARQAVISLARERQSARAQQLPGPTEQRFSPGPAEVHERAMQLFAPKELPEPPASWEMIRPATDEELATAQRGMAVMREALARMQARSQASPNGNQQGGSSSGDRGDEGDGVEPAGAGGPVSGGSVPGGD